MVPVPNTPRGRRLLARANIAAALRDVLRNQGFLEVDTPLMIQAPAPEPSIEAFAVPQGRGAADLFLIPSPELNLKRLLSRGFRKIFQMGPVFRKGERGRYHLPEFRMLEWYRSDAGYEELMADCEILLGQAARACGLDGSTLLFEGREIDIRPPFQRMTVDEAFRSFAGWTPGPSPDLSRFNEDMATKVEPNLPKNRPVFLMDYPAACASLARLKDGHSEVAERVELYVAGIELANGFSELTDRAEQEERFRRDGLRRLELGLAPYPPPEAFLASLQDLPPCAGMALGVDRLVMLMTDATSIDEVVPFVPEAIPADARTTPGADCA